MNSYWTRRRWVDGRTGHAIYLMFPLTMINFIIVTYRFLIEGESELKDLISNLWLFGLIFIITYIPISIIIGFWHRRTQLSVENNIKYLENPLYSKMFRVLLDVQTGKINKEEIEKFRKVLTDIEKK
ncbi:hypothetical protein [Candidatus Nitrosarchaeum limnium]|uniref:Uncharacterized protein n=1 Tax=Candidatus Nitrosarchaeum limnium BG20 TaxID=859192 RepID=S2EKX8_9ARCH|nr:hypothetical protein [Candidatus Nitrosarchaeum limnium]EPA05292.1 hypothetical protein BG20_I0115 [Candidatus Nitrosarchaeum limnium BG20]